MTDTSLVPHRTAPLLRGADLDDTYRLAKAIALSRRFPDATNAEQALVKILCGRDLGMTAMQSMMGIHIVEGKPMVAAVTLGSFVRQLADYDYRVLSHSDEECSIEFGRGEAPGRNEAGEWLPWPGSLGISSFSMADAEKAKLVKEKSGWVKYPRNMLFARAMSNGVKWYTPDATQGIPVYYEGEISVTAELSDGEGTGEPRGIELPPEVEEIIARAEDLGHAGWADRPTWELRADRGTEVLAKSVEEATADLDAMPETAVVEPDLPIDDEDLPLVPDVDEVDLGDGEELLGGRSGGPVEPSDSVVQNLGGGDAPADESAPSSSASEGSDGEAAAQEVPEIEVLRAQRRVYAEIPAVTPAEEDDKKVLLDGLDRRIEALAQDEAKENPDQGELLS